MLSGPAIPASPAAATAADIAPADLTPFRPTPAAAANIFSAIASGRVSLFDLAAQHNTTLTDLIVWLESPETSQRHAALNHGLAAAVRTASLAHLAAAAPALARTLNEFSQSPAPQEPASRESSAAQLRYAMLAVRAASLLYRMSRISGDAPRKLLPRQGESRPQPWAGASALLPSTSPRAEAGGAAQPGVGALASSTQSSASTSPTSDIPLPTSHITPPAPAFSTVSSRASAPPSSTSDIPHPTSDVAPPTTDFRPTASHAALLETIDTLTDEDLFAAFISGEIDPADVLAATGHSVGPAP